MFSAENAVCTTFSAEKGCFMPRCIIKIKDRYFVWSTIVDAPVTHGMTEPQIKAYYKRDRQGVSDWSARMARVEETGTSWLGGETLDETLAGNRAGKDENELTADEIYQQYSAEYDTVDRKQQLISGTAAAIDAILSN